MASSTHLAILVHGAWGFPANLQHLLETITSIHKTSVDNGSLKIIIPKSNSNNLTYDGIEVGAERIFIEIQKCIEDLEKEGKPIKKISIVGYSMGGLVARYLIGLMDRNGIFDKAQPVNFTTFASPHIGIRTPKQDLQSSMWDYLGSRSLSVSGQQMFLADNFRNTGRPLLEIMADPSSVFFKALKKFEKKWLYANTTNDRAVPFYTAAFSRVDPFIDENAIEVHYLDDPEASEPVLLDPKNPVSLKANHEVTFAQRYLSGRALGAIPFYAALTVAVPIIAPIFFANAGYQTWHSSNRVKLHEADSAHSEHSRILLLEQAQAATDEIVGRVAAERPEEYLPTPPPEKNNASSGSDSEPVKLAREQASKNDTEFPTLALSKLQFDMIDNLETVGFTRYWAHIIKSRHTHAAIVVRMSTDRFNEGRVVVQHWAREFKL